MKRGNNYLPLTHGPRSSPQHPLRLYQLETDTRYLRVRSRISYVQHKLLLIDKRPLCYVVHPTLSQTSKPKLIVNDPRIDEIRSVMTSLKNWHSFLDERREGCPPRPLGFSSYREGIRISPTIFLEDSKRIMSLLRPKKSTHWSRHYLSHMYDCRDGESHAPRPMSFFFIRPTGLYEFGLVRSTLIGDEDNCRRRVWKCIFKVTVKYSLSCLSSKISSDF